MSLNEIAVAPIEAVGQYLYSAFENFKASAPIEYAEIAERYYNQENDILQTRIMYQNDNGDIVEDTSATNTRIAHGFFAELVDQKVQYILGDDGIEVCPANEDDSKLGEHLKEYFTDDWQLVVQELIEGASIKGFEGLFARTTTDDRLVFQIADGTKVVPVFDDYGVLVRVLRYYNERRYSSSKQQVVTIEHCDVWDDMQVAYYVAEREGTGTNFKLDPSRDINPAPHVEAMTENPAYVEGETDESERWLPLGRSYERFPFNILNNNRQGTSDLQPIKLIIDDYDLMNCFMSNNLQDMSEAFYVVKGFQGEGIDKLKQNIKSRKVVNLAPHAEAGVDIQTYNIPVEGRRTKMELDEVNIYRSGMGFNSQQLGDGNITNVVIASRYTLLAMKASKIIARLKASLKWQAELVAADINRRYGGNYVGSDIEFKIEPQTIVNESDIIADKKIKAETKQVQVSTVLLAAPRIGDEETLRQLCDVYDLDYNELEKELAEAEAAALEATVPPLNVDPNTGLPIEQPTGGQEIIDPATGLPVVKKEEQQFDENGKLIEQKV